MLDNGIKFDERYDSEDYGTTTLYFIAPKEMLKKYIPKSDYPEAISMEISIEFPTNHIEANYANVCVSPTREEKNGTEDYDWHDVNIPHDEIEGLIKLADAFGAERAPVSIVVPEATAKAEPEEAEGEEIPLDM